MLFWLVTTLGAVASAVTLIAFFAPDWGRRLVVMLSPGPHFDWASVPHHIKHARHRVFVLQTWLPGLRLELPLWREALTKEGMEFRVILMDQKLVPLRLRCREPVSDLLTQNVSDLAELARAFKSPAGRPRLQARFYSCIPFGPVYIIDDDIYWGLYLSDRDSMQGPVFHNRTTSILGHQIIASYEAIWQSASHRTGELTVSAHHLLSRPMHAAHANEEVDIERKILSLSNLLFPLSGPDVANLKTGIGCLCLMRHADTDLNAADIVTGDLDVGINAQGREKARSKGKALRDIRWNHIYASRLRRCTETLAEALADKYENIDYVEDLRERAMGDLEGYYKQTYGASLPAYAGRDILGSLHAAPNGGERYCDVFWRIIPLLEEMISKVRSGERILVCSHEAPIRMMLMALENLPGKTALEKTIGNVDTFYFTAQKMPSSPS